MESEDNTILGYYQDGRPIHPPKRGFVYTQAFIICSVCNKAISPMGGPGHGSICISCHEKKQ